VNLQAASASLLQLHVNVYNSLNVSLCTYMQYALAILSFKQERSSYDASFKLRVIELQRTLKPRLHDTTGCQNRVCQTGFTTRFDNRVERTALFVQHGCKTGLYNRFDNRLYTRYSRLSNRFDNQLYRVYKHFTRLSNRFDNRLYCVNGA